ncbi:MAG: AMP-binding protein, partial [Fimbriimonadaceae bacterium]|nr:AMP-binding protein [Fimbriimonadaceae bacterium]
TADFYLALGLTVLQGYGLTEACAASNLNLPEDNRPWTVGPPLKGVEMKIAEDGEILFRGRSIMAGYYNLPEETKAAFTEDGWFKTGDIGELENGSLKITDRKKDLIVLSNGKNVAPQKIENLLKQSDYIQEAVVFGDGSHFCYALVIPDFAALGDRMKRDGVAFASDEALITLPQAEALIKAEVDRVNAGLADFEKVKRHTVLGRALSIDEGELTPSMKVKRKVVRERYDSALSSLVNSGS